MEKLKFRKPYDTRHRCQCLKEPGETITKQEFKDDCDMNLIIKKGFTNLKVHEPQSGEQVVHNPDITFHDMQCYMKQTEEMWQNIPAKIRAKFHNDPGEYLEFCGDENNHEELVKMGLANPKPVSVETTGKPEPGTKVIPSVPSTPSKEGTAPQEP